MSLLLLWQAGAIFCSCGVGNPIAGTGSFLAGCADAFPFQRYLFAGFRLWLDAGAFSCCRSDLALCPSTGLSGCHAFCLNAFLFLYYFLAGQWRLYAGAFSTRCGGGFCPITDFSGCRTFSLNAFLFLYYFLAGQWRLDAGAFSNGASGFNPITDLSGCRTFVLKALLFL